MTVEKEDRAAVSVVIEDGREFSHFYDELVASRTASRRALKTLARDGSHQVSPIR